MKTKVIAVVQDKGGVGKSTLSINLAVVAQLLGLRVAILDIDPQASAYEWSEQRASAPEAITITKAALPKMMATLNDEGFHLAIIDTAKGDQGIAFAAAAAADLCLVPAVASALDLRAIKNTFSILSLAHKEALIVLNRIRPGNKQDVTDTGDLILEELKDFPDLKVRFAPIIVHERAAFKKSGLGKGVVELEPDSPAASEINALYQWLADELDLPEQNNNTVTHAASA